MAGLDKIISHILEEAGNEARAIEKKSEAEAESIRQEAVKTVSYTHLHHCGKR